MSVVHGRIASVTTADLLAFEAANPVHTPAKEERIRRELGITPTRYVVLLARAAASADGVAADPLTARRVRERAARRAAARERRSRSMV
jgi:hypothetical protein